MTDLRDDKILGYLRSRGTVPVPDNMSERVRATADAPAIGRPRLDAGRPLLAGSAVVFLVIAAFVAVNAMNPSVSSRPDGSQSPTPKASAFRASAFPVIGAPFPASVVGMPVINVTDATALASSGRLDGRDVAIGGYFTQGSPMCPYPRDYQGPLWDWCRIASFADTVAAATNCTPLGTSGVACDGGVEPGPMVPLFMSETIGGNDSRLYTIYPTPIVVIAHVADPRWLQCSASEATACKQKLVVDRLAWVNGSDIEPTAHFDRVAVGAVTTNLTLTQVASLLGNVEILSAVVTTDDAARTYDPRWNLTGSRVVWVVRTPSRVTDVSAQDPTRAVTVSVIDDGTGQLFEQAPLALPSDWNPARVWVTETRLGVDVNSMNSIAALYRVTSEGGTVLVDGMVGGGGGGNDNALTYGPDLPLIIDPGTYQLTAWIGPRSITVPGPDWSPRPIAECFTEHTFAAGDDVLLNATYDHDGTCSWSDGARPSFGFP